MKMRLIMSCLLLSSVVWQCVLAASAVTVGLYAPDRYNGIPETCLMPMDFGYCRAKVKRYYFDMRRMKCAMFYFGGCAGNVNNFKSLEECNKLCLDGYGDYDSPNDVVYNNAGRDYRNRGNVISNTASSDNSNSNNNGNGNNNNNNNIKNTTSTASFSSTSGVGASYKNTYNKYNSNYKANIASTNVQLNNNSSGASIQNSTKIIRNKSDDNLDEYDEYEEN